MVERRIQHAFGDHRINPKREFFRINPERVLSILELLELDNVTPNNDYVENQEEQRSLEKERNRRSRFKFSSVEILVGSILHFIRDKSVTAKVVDDQKIEFEGGVSSLSQLSLELLTRDYGWKSQTVAGTLSERRLRLEEEVVTQGP